MTHAEDGSGRGTRAVLAGLIAALVLAGMLHAREAGTAEEDTELAKKTQNPGDRDGTNDSPLAAARTSVPGTEEAKDAVLLARSW